MAQNQDDTTSRKAQIHESLPTAVEDSTCESPDARGRKRKPVPENLGCTEVLSPPAKRKASVSGFSLYVKWQCSTGKPRLHHLTLRRIAGVDDLSGTQHDLVSRSLPEHRRPPHLASHANEFYHYSPIEECLSLPSDVVDTQFKLVVHYDGWEYVVYERQDRAESTPVDERPMLVTVVEFESTALVIGQLGIRIKLVSYPIISIKKAFLDDIEDKLINDPNFRGILSA